MSGSFGKGTSVTALRAQMRAASDNPPAPPKKNKNADLEDLRDKAAEKAERMSMAQHQTSLLKIEPKSSRTRVLEKPKKRGIPFVLQLLAVLVVAGGVAFALDPSLMAHVQPYLEPLEPYIQSLRDMVGL